MQPPRKKLMLLAKWLIAVVVVVGLTWAARSAIRQWQEQTAAAESVIARLDDRIAAESSGSERDQLIQQRDELIASVPSLGNLRWQRICTAALLYASGIFIPGLVLHQALASLGERPRLSTSIAAQLLGHLGKYVPGKAMVIVLRAGTLSRDNVRPIPATIAVFMETLLMMGVGATLACGVICWLDVPTWMIGAAILVAIVASVPTIPPILKRVARRVAKVDAENTASDLPEQTATTISATKFFLVGWTWSLASWLLIGASFSTLVTAIPIPIINADNSNFKAATDARFSTEPASATHPLKLAAASTAAIGLAMVVGFASLLPGGAGVRELVVTTILATEVGLPHALLAAIAARMMFIVVEAACACAAWLWLRREPISASNRNNPLADEVDHGPLNS